MQVIATAGHVDHGKSTLIRALTGMDPDRLVEERRRGLTVDLGYAWTTLPNGEEISFVDVPGHQRFIANMLAGIGPAPAVLFVVAADEGWAAQSDDHLAALHALGVQHGLLVVTRSDKADPAPAMADGLRRLAASSVGEVDAVAVSATSGDGLADVVRGLERLVGRLPPPDRDAPTRLWIDRAFTIRGAGTVVTGTLGAGSVALSRTLTLSDHPVTVRSIQVNGAAATSVVAVSRVAINLRGVGTAEIARGDALLAPDEFTTTSLLDVRLSALPAAPWVRVPARLEPTLPTELVLHVGTAAVPVRVRRLDDTFARLRLERPLPLRAGDRGVLRDPGRQSVAAGALVVDADPPAFRRRGAAARRAEELRGAGDRPDAALEVRRRGAVRRDHLRRLGIDTAALPDVHGWLVSPERHAVWRSELAGAVDDWAARHPLQPGIPRVAACRLAGVPDDVLDDLVPACGLVADGGLIRRATSSPVLGRHRDALETVQARLAENPFAAPDQEELHRLGLGQRELAVAVRQGRLIRLADGIVLAPDAPVRAVSALAGLGDTFTVSAARQALGTTRRVAVPLLEHLDSLGMTERVDSTSRRLVDTESSVNDTFSQQI